MHDAMLGTGEKNRHGLAYDGVHILMEETENKEYIYIYIYQYTKYFQHVRKPL